MPAFNEYSDTSRQAPGEGPVTVVVVSGGPLLGNRLRTALGDGVVGIAPVHRIDAGAIRVLTGLRPRVVVFDAEDPPVGANPDMIAKLATKTTHPGRCALVVWGTESDFGSRMAASFRDLSAPNCMTLFSHDGIEPLLDIVRSKYAEF